MSGLARRDSTTAACRVVLSLLAVALLVGFAPSAAASGARPMVLAVHTGSDRGLHGPRDERVVARRERPVGGRPVGDDRRRARVHHGDPAGLEPAVRRPRHRHLGWHGAGRARGRRAALPSSCCGCRPARRVRSSLPAVPRGLSHRCAPGQDRHCPPSVRYAQTAIDRPRPEYARRANCRPHEPVPVRSWSSPPAPTTGIPRWRGWRMSLSRPAC